ncbi:uncharacterized protein UTRI_00561 [Ustilago trichophora]|uniref:Uncharacterized protein n=1 Tax=Ustilago trichophora TaxID=86804 RepID=A0A5C3DRN8_9BASI|nr:uncharacterized protein UTRI_00561 [Ustilago trichophora]
MKFAIATLFASIPTLTLAAILNTAPFSPTSDPGVYPPDGDQNPVDGWTTLPSIPGARIDNSTLVAGSGSATLLHYIDSVYDASKIKRAVIQIHGENRDAWNQWMYADLAAKRAATGGSFDRDEVVVMAPMFLNTADEGAYPFDPTLDSGNAVTSTQDTAITPTARQSYAQQTGLPSRRSMTFQKRGRHKIPLQKVSTTQVMIWKSVEWGDGSPAYEPLNSNRAGSFDALDAAVNFFLDRQRFPHLRKVVVAGFSLGAQLTNRYATFRNDTSEDSRITYWISSPNSFVYLTGDRPAKIGAACRSTYSEYKYGLNGTLPNYYMGSSNRLGPSGMISRYLNRTIYYLVGMRDTSAGLDSCGPNSQGSGHLDKMWYWTQEVIPMLPGSTGKEGKMPSNNLVRFIQDTGHQDWKVITSDPGVETVWLKGWYANGTDAKTPPSNGVVAGKVPSKSFITNETNGVMGGSNEVKGLIVIMFVVVVTSLLVNLL